MENSAQRQLRKTSLQIIPSLEGHLAQENMTRSHFEFKTTGENLAQSHSTQDNSAPASPFGSRLNHASVPLPLVPLVLEAVLDPVVIEDSLAGALAAPCSFLTLLPSCSRLRVVRALAALSPQLLEIAAAHEALAATFLL